MIQVYQTRDGQTFENAMDANEHEDELFDVWLTQDDAKMLTAQDILEGLDDFDETEFFDTPRAIFIALLRRYFDAHEECGE
jgi:hypothetical protein